MLLYLQRCVSRGIPEQCIDKATRAEENWQVRKRRVMEAARSGVWSEERSKKMIQLLEHQSVATDVNQLMYSLECESQDESSQSDHTQTKSFTSTPGATFTEKSIKPLTSWTHENQVCTKSSSASLGAADLASTSSTSHAGARRRSSNCEAASAPWLEESGNCTDTCEEHD